MSRIDQRNAFSVSPQFLVDPSASVGPDVCWISDFVYSSLFAYFDVVFGSFFVAIFFVV